VTAWERAAYALSALLIVSALAFWPIVKRVDPRFAVACSPGSWRINSSSMSLVSADEVSDPWGNEWDILNGDRWTPGLDPYPWRPLISRGQDGIASADDVRTSQAREHPFVRVLPRVVLVHPSTVLTVLGLGLAAWKAVSRRLIRARRWPVEDEAITATFMTALPWLAITPWLMRPVPAIDESTFTLVVPPRVALALTWTALLFLPAFAWRLSRPRVDA
jgi:hypothetical protein